MLHSDWNQKSKRWGHPFHAMCPYADTFPASLPHYFIQKFTRRGDVVLDPFCGRGTTPLQACIEGRIGVGLDPNPLAFALTRAKVCPPDPIDIRNRIDDLSNDMFFEAADHEPDDIRMLYHKTTLRQLVFLKQVLDPGNNVDAFLTAVLLGILYGSSHETKKSSRQIHANSHKFLSVPIPHNASISPASIRQHIAKNNLVAPEVDVFTCLRARIKHICRMGMPQQRGHVWNGRVQNIRVIHETFIRQKEVKLIITAPPGMRTPRNGLHNWIRLWFLNESAEAVDTLIDQHRKMKDYLEFMRETCRQLYQVMAPDSICAFVISDLKKANQEPIPLAQEVWKYLEKKRTHFQLAEIVEEDAGNGTDAETEAGKIQSNTTAINRVLVMYKGEYEELTDHVAW